MNKLLNYRKAKVTAFSGDVTRTEVIDLRSNRLFSRCKNIGDIEKAYEAFWDLGSGPHVEVMGVVLVP